MSLPTTQWFEWSRPSIEPHIKAVVHFPSGSVTFTDDDILELTIDVSLFDSKFLLWGPPTPGRATLSIIDINQVYNPVYNPNLTEGIQISIFLGITTNFYINWASAKQYTWEAASQFTWSSGSSTIVWQPCGIFYTQEWTYDTESNTASVDCVDSMHYALLLDNRADGLAPATNINGLTFLINYLQLYSSVLNDATFIPTELQDISYILDYSFYEYTHADTINNLCLAMARNYFFLPDGSAALCSYAGMYNTDIVLTDDDVTSYAIQQTSVNTYDSAAVEYFSASLQQRDALSLSNIVTDAQAVLWYSIGRVFTIDYVYLVPPNNSDVIPTMFNTSVSAISNITANTYTWLELSVVAQIVSGEYQSESSSIGQSPYTLSSNGYIQVKASALSLSVILDRFIQLIYNTIEVTIRGCSGLWVGARLTFSSDLYGISEHTYVVIHMSISYTGSIYTTLVLQRVDF